MTMEMPEPCKVWNGKAVPPFRSLEDPDACGHPYIGFLFRCYSDPEKGSS